MNMQAMLQQAQKMQKEITKKKEELSKKEFVGKSQLVDVKVNGDRKVLAVDIHADSLDKDDIEMLQDLIVVATNDAMKQIDKETESKLGKYTQGMPGLF